MRIDKKSLIRATIFSAILGLNGVTTMGEEDRPRDRSRWDINNSQNNHATEMVEMDDLDENGKKLIECSICLESKNKVLKTYCCKHDICEECIKNIDEMARYGKGFRTQNRCPFCRNQDFKEGWGKLVKEVVKTEKDEDNTKLILGEKEKQKISLMGSKQKNEVIASIQAAANAQAQADYILEQIAAQKEKTGSVDPELEKELKLQLEIKKNNIDAVEWDLQNAAVPVATDKISDKYSSDKVSDEDSSDQKPGDFAEKEALEQAISIARRDTYNETLKYGRDVNKVGADLANMERALAVLNRTYKNDRNTENVVATANNDQYVAQEQKKQNGNNQLVKECLQMYHNQQARNLANYQMMQRQVMQQNMMQQQMAYQQQMAQQMAYQQQMAQQMAYQQQMAQQMAYQQMVANQARQQNALDRMMQGQNQ